jgi:hypothetical protein
MFLQSEDCMAQHLRRQLSKLMTSAIYFLSTLFTAVLFYTDLNEKKGLLHC